MPDLEPHLQNLFTPREAETSGPENINQTLIDNLTRNYPDCSIPLNSQKDSSTSLLFPLSPVVAIYVTPEGAFRVNSGIAEGAQMLAPDDLRAVVAEHRDEIPPYKVLSENSPIGEIGVIKRFNTPMPCRVDGETIGQIAAEITEYPFTGEYGDEYKKAFFDQLLGEGMINRTRRTVEEYKKNLPDRVEYFKKRAAERK